MASESAARHAMPAFRVDAFEIADEQQPEITGRAADPAGPSPWRRTRDTGPPRIGRSRARPRSRSSARRTDAPARSAGQTRRSTTAVGRSLAVPIDMRGIVVRGRPRQSASSAPIDFHPGLLGAVTQRPRFSHLVTERTVIALPPAGLAAHDAPTYWHRPGRRGTLLPAREVGTGSSD